MADAGMPRKSTKAQEACDGPVLLEAREADNISNSAVSYETNRATREDIASWHNEVHQENLDQQDLMRSVKSQEVVQADVDSSATPGLQGDMPEKLPSAAACTKSRAENRRKQVMAKVAEDQEKNREQLFVFTKGSNRPGGTPGKPSPTPATQRSELRAPSETSPKASMDSSPSPGSPDRLPEKSPSMDPSARAESRKQQVSAKVAEDQKKAREKLFVFNQRKLVLTPVKKISDGQSKGDAGELETDDAAADLHAKP